jgi:hypothetical protein
MTCAIELDDKRGTVRFVSPEKQPGRTRYGGRRIRIYHVPSQRSKKDLLRIVRDHDIRERELFYEVLKVRYGIPRKRRPSDQPYPRTAFPKTPDQEAARIEREAKKALKDKI